MTRLFSGKSSGVKAAIAAKKAGVGVTGASGFGFEGSTQYTGRPAAQARSPITDITRRLRRDRKLGDARTPLNPPPPNIM